MDKEREIRFLYPPFIVGAYFIWGWLSDPQGWQQLSTIAAVLANLGPAVGTAAGIIASGSLVVVIGYLLGTLTYATMRSFAMICRFETHEIPKSADARQIIWRAAGSHRDFPSQIEQHMATTWLDFHLCQEGVHEWVVRRWNAFNLSANVVTGISLCFPLAHVWWHGGQTLLWWCTGVGLVLLFLLNACIAWRDTMHMLRYAAEMERRQPRRI